VRIVKRVIVPVVPREMLFRLIEFISQALTEDAREKFGKSYKFKIHVRSVGQSAIETYIQFFPYKYDFIWKVNRDKIGYEVVLDARTPGKWTDALLNADKKLENLVDSQWSAFLNFCHGYLTALAYHASKRLPKKHIKKSKQRLREK